MTTITVSDQGQVVIPAIVCQQLGIKPGCQLSFRLEGSGIRVEIEQTKVTTTIEEGFGMLVCPPGKTRRLEDFDIGQAMQDSYDRD